MTGAGERGARLTLEADLRVVADGLVPAPARAPPVEGEAAPARPPPVDGDAPPARAPPVPGGLEADADPEPGTVSSASTAASASTTASAAFAASVGIRADPRLTDLSGA